MEKEASFPCIRKSRTARFRKQILSEHRHSLDAIIVTKGLVTQPINENSVHGADWQHRPLCLKQVIRELQQDFILAHKLALGPSETNYATSGSLPNISDLRLTEVALQHATAYKQTGQLFKECNSSSSFERILEEKLNYSRRKWRRYTETGKYNKMWQSLGRDIQDRHDNRKRDREKAPGSGQTSHSSVREREQLTAAKHKDNPKENLSTQFSKQGKNSYTNSRYRSPRQVLPRIILPDWTPKGENHTKNVGKTEMSGRIVGKRRTRSSISSYEPVTSRVFLGNIWRTSFPFHGFVAKLVWWMSNHERKQAKPHDTCGTRKISTDRH